MPKTALPTPADFLAAGDISGLIEFHRSRWGDLRMEADGDDAGDATDEDSDAGNSGDDDPADDEDDEKLREPGKKALTRERDRRQKAEQRAKALEKRLSDIEKANESDVDKRVREAKEAGRSEVVEQTAEALVRFALRAQGLTDDDLDDAVDAFNTKKAIKDGEIDEDFITRYARRQGGGARKQDDPDKAPAAAYGGGRAQSPKQTAKERAREARLARGLRRDGE